MGHSEAVRFHYPTWVVEQDPLLLTAITVNLSLALTPSAPKKKFARIDQPYAMFVGSEDELYDLEKFLPIMNCHMKRSSNNQSMKCWKDILICPFYSKWENGLARPSKCGIVLFNMNNESILSLFLKILH